MPEHWFGYIINRDDHPESEINIALRLAASGLKEDIAKLVLMVKTNPRLLLQAGKVVTRAGISVTRTTLYEFFLGEGDPDGAKQIEFGFANIPNGEGQRLRQYERYRPYLSALAAQVESKQPAFDLRPLVKRIKESSVPDITEALNINDLNRTATRNTPLRAALAQFRKAVKPKKSIAIGMHYEHYTTLQQAFDLLDDEWEALSDHCINFDKCRLVWQQIIGYLQRGLPAVDRFGFARAFDDKDRTLSFKYDNNNGSFPDVISTEGDIHLSGLGFDAAIFGRAGAVPLIFPPIDNRYYFEIHVEQKLQACRTYAATSRPKTSASVIC